jgi:hypothetical protein
MVVISSQETTVSEIVEEKLIELATETSVTLPVVFAGEFEGAELYILVDGHHRLDAAQQLGISIVYDVVDAKDCHGSSDTLDGMLELYYLDCGWYNVETGNHIF